MVTYSKSLKFAEFTLNPDKRLLFRERQEIKLRNKEFEVLLFLIESAPKPCSPEEILEAVWKETNVEENSVNKVIANIRKVLNEDRANPRFIKNIRGQGFVFIGDVEEVSDKLSKQKSSPQKALQNELNTLLDGRSILKKALLILGLLILMGTFWIVWQKRDYLWTRLTKKVIFADDFSGNEIDTTLWNVKSKTVKVENGIAKIVVETTTEQPKLESALFSFDRTKPVVIKTRLKVSYSQNLKDKVYFMGVFGITPKTPLFSQVDVHNKYFFGVNFTNHDYESRDSNGDLDLMRAEGFFLFKNCGAPYRKNDYRDGKISGRIEPVWHEWFDQKIIYNPQNGEMSYFINDTLKEVFNIGDLVKEMDEDKLRIEIAPWGWWTNHSIELDYIEVTQ